ncbi:atlastin [Trichonephila clavipes]|nr:atlastin [Trichonephila clavipes]
MYFASGIFGVIGMIALANLCNLVMGVVLLTLCLWTYIRYSGDMRDVGSQIDVLSSTIFREILKPAYKMISDQSLSHLISLADDPGVSNFATLASQGSDARSICRELKRPPVGVVVRRGVPAQVSSSSLDHGSE